jgi:hypothetical protein
MTMELALLISPLPECVTSGHKAIHRTAYCAVSCLVSCTPQPYSVAYMYIELMAASSRRQKFNQDLTPALSLSLSMMQPLATPTACCLPLHAQSDKRFTHVRPARESKTIGRYQETKLGFHYYFRIL